MLAQVKGTVEPVRVDPFAGLVIAGGKTVPQAVYVKSLDNHIPPDLYQSLTYTVLPLVGKPLTVLDVLLPRLPLLSICWPPEVVPTQSHHSVTGVPLFDLVKITSPHGNVDPGAGLVIAGDEIVSVKAVYVLRVDCHTPPI